MVVSKLTSRKFWICVAAFLASVGTGIAGLHSDNQIIAAMGIICAIGSTAIYAAAEAYVDGKDAQSDTYINVADDNKE